MDPLENNTDNVSQGGVASGAGVGGSPMPNPSSPSSPAPNLNPSQNMASGIQPAPNTVSQPEIAQPGGYAAAPEQNSSQMPAQPLSVTNNGPQDMNADSGMVPSSSQKMDINYMPDPVKKKSKLKFVIMAVAAVLLLAGGGLFYLNINKTSAEAKREFSAATTALSSSSSSFTLSASTVTMSSGDEAKLEDAVKKFDESIIRFEEAVSKLKSDVKDLKNAANAYLVELKAFRSNEANLAIEVAKINSSVDTEGMLSFNSASGSDVQSYFREVDRITAIYSSSKVALEGLDLKMEKAIELRDIYASMIGRYIELFAEIKVAVSSGDLGAISSAQAELSRADQEFGYSDKENEIENILDSSSESAQKRESARAALNAEITKINQRR
jgi:hypothetical protein